jgi:urease accessory protein
MELVFASAGERTCLESSYCEVPFKITRVLDSHLPLAHLVLMHSTAGLFGGDDIGSTIRVDPGARVVITQQAATQVHPSADRTALQSTTIAVGDGAELHYDLEPVIPFAGSRFRQRTRITVSGEARMSAWEGFTAGRTGRGERWRFAAFESETRLIASDETTGATDMLYLDRFLLEPDRKSERAPWAMGDADYLGTGLYYGQDAPRLARRLHESLPHAGVDCPAPGLLVCRLLAPTGPDLHSGRATFRRVVRES